MTLYRRRDLYDELIFISMVKKYIALPIVFARNGIKTIRKSRKNTIIALFVLLLLGFGVWKTFAQSSQKPQYQTVQVEKGSIVATVSESGSVTAGSEVNVPSTTTGVIEEVYVKDGDTVTSGDNLFKVKSTATSQQQAASFATYQSAVSALTTAKDNQQSLDATMWTAQQGSLDAQNTQNYKNNNTTNPSTKQGYTYLEKLSIDSTVTQAQKNFSATEQKYKDAGVAIAAAQAQVNSAWLSYQATQNSVVIAPVGGTIANFATSVGGYVSGGGSSASSDTASTTTSTGTPILVIGDFSQVSVAAQASEVDIPKLKVGQKATITLDAFPGKTFVGTVSQMNKIGTTTSGVVTYNISISFVSVPPDVLPGMTASMTIQIDRRDDVITVPSSAIQNTNGQSMVRVLKNNQVTQVPVETGLVSDTDTEIVSGLSVGDTIVTSVSSATTTGNRAQGASPFSGIGGRGFGGGGGFRGGGGEGH